MTTSTLTVTGFVTARIAEDEERARDFEEHQARAINGDYGTGGGQWAAPMWHGIEMIGFTPARVLAQCAALRKIVEEHGLNPYYGLDRYGRWLPHTGEPKCWFCDCQDEDGLIRGEAPCDTLRALASIWSDHPDFREEWR